MICEEFNEASSGINIMLCCISKIEVMCVLNAFFLVFLIFNKSSFLYQNKYKKNTNIFFET
jgi:hypothetical protein